MSARVGQLQLPQTQNDGGVGREWQSQAVRRLRFVALAAAAVALVSMPMSLLAKPNIGVRAGAERPLWVLPVGLVLSILMYFVARSERLSLQARLDLGLGYLVSICATAAIFRHSLPYADSDVVRGVSPVPVAILFFAVLVPVSPKRLAVAAAVATVMDPLALWVSVAAGMPSPPINIWIWLFAPDVFTAVLAVVVSSVLLKIARTLKEAREMGSYRLISKLGAGGMGEVWRAEHRSLARPAAVKLVKASKLGGSDTRSVERALGRFEREAQATALLSSPHTIELYDFGVAADGTFFYVMELLEGMDLATMVERAGALEPARVVHLLLQIAHSLRDAHDSGLIHRDIKPANIYVCHKGGEHDFIKVLDFGLVKRFRSDDDAQLTAAGVVAGTPAYMAPEAVRAKNVDPRSDIYSLGCVAYVLLTGKDVFPNVDGVAPMLLAHVEREPVPLAQAAEQEVDPRLSAIVMRCLAKAQDERFQSAGELMAALTATGLAQAWTQELAAVWWSNHGGATADDALATAPTETAVGVV